MIWNIDTAYYKLDAYYNFAPNNENEFSTLGNSAPARFGDIDTLERFALVGIIKLNLEKLFNFFMFKLVKFYYFIVFMIQIKHFAL